jgi:sterol desaturase/sphingolipid hydroxylase (fatty acid hydroxylase superfamily)|tara:strand:+ start:1839 stop:2357 length:519 start_codon:yes stop_codon:yes gene_type:complete
LIEFLLFIGIAALHLISIPIALLYGVFMEWALHKYVLHGLGSRKKSIWSFHWHEHHKISRQNDFYDHQYEDDFTGAPLREKISLFLLALAHLPLIIYVPFFYIALVYHSIKYYKIHKYAHLHPIWGKVHLRWHYDHHMGKDQNANWGVTSDIFDKIFNTRKEYTQPITRRMD